MEDIYSYTSNWDRISLEDLPWFYAKSKVPICLAITECELFLDRFKEAAILSEEESLELQADTRSVHRVIYESLCWIEEKNFPLDYFFNKLFQKPFLKIYPNLKPIYKEYRQGQYRSGMQTNTDKDKDQMIFAQEKVKICLAITDPFPFIQGLQDLTILSEIESLRLQADGRPVSRVIYECLSLIEKKDLKLSVVFEYIFQQCYQTLYPDLQIILQESNMEQVGSFNGQQHPVFNKSGDLLEFFKNNKSDISAAINEYFPFLNGLHDMGMLSKLKLLKLQADKRPASDVLYDALSWIQERSDIEAFFAHMFREFYLSRFPALKTILFKLNQALILDRSCLIPGMEDMVKKETRTCRLKPICYAEVSENDCELVDEKKPAEGVKSLLHQKPGKKHKGEKLCIPTDGKWDVTMEQGWIRGAVNVTVKLEFPKQVFGDEFYVRCGHKTGIFLKKLWKGDARNDMCITCDRQRFTVTKFEKYGGREASKNWKKTILCAGITMEKLFQSGVLKCPRNIRRKLLL